MTPQELTDYLYEVGIYEKKVETIHKAISCPICYLTYDTVIFDPCGHVCCCKCAKELTVCHMCRSLIKKTILIRFPH
jgi:hypothetical protein